MKLTFLVASALLSTSAALNFPSLFPSIKLPTHKTPSSCKADSDCGGSGWQCRTRPGQCGGTGHCVRSLAFCFFKGQPVCGCDGTTYESSCEAYKGGTNVDTFGKCGGPPDVPTGVAPEDVPLPPPGVLTSPVPVGRIVPVFHPSCRGDSDCAAAGTYCRRTTCGAGDAGVCVNVPEICTMEFNPVCGCDGFTYSNKCQAARASVSISSFGACTSTKPVAVPNPVTFPATLFPAGEPQSCGGWFGSACKDPRALCVMRGGMCNVADAGGYCVVVEEVADCGGEVCGCRGFTWKNKCEAWKNGDEVNYGGPCTKGGKGGGAPTWHVPVIMPRFAPIPPISPLPSFFMPHGAPSASDGKCEEEDDCGEDEYCKKPMYQCGAVGECHAKPNCSMGSKHFLLRVCGCDGETYDSVCEANNAGVPLRGFGACRGGSRTLTPVKALFSCKSSDDCSDGQFCKFAKTDSCGMHGETGVCSVKPKCRTPVGKVPWVCGCDSKPYKTECDANAAGASAGPWSNCLPSP